MRAVVVGAGLAAASAVEELRTAGHSGEIVVLGDEPHPPYERPPLSKDVLLGAKPAESAFLHDADWYAERDVDLRTDTPVTALDPDRRQVVTAGGALGYDRLLLATGSRPRRLPPVEESGVTTSYLRTMDDARALDEGLHEGARLLVVGAGWIGLEVAAAARQRGAEVTVAELAPLPLQAVLGSELGTVFADLHREHGVDLRLGTGVDSVQAGPDGTARIGLGDGTTLEVDRVVIGIGVQPNDDLARSSGLACENGVLVDPTLRSSDPAVFAAGDVAAHDHPRLGRLRVEHWDTAIHQGRAAARSILGEDAPYDRLPYFYTDQYEVGMEYVGHVGGQGYDEVLVRGDRAGRKLVALWTRGETVLAGMHLNEWDAIEELRSLVGGPVPAGWA